jgi:hypothetical protein
LRKCAQCCGEVADEHRFCPWCATPQRLKIVQFFSPHAAIAADRGKLLRVSRYLGLPTAEPHVRFSVWNEEGVAEAAVSLDEEEAGRLAGFILARIGSAPDTGGWLRVIVSQVRAEISAGRRSEPRADRGRRGSTRTGRGGLPERGDTLPPRGWGSAGPGALGKSN